MNFSDKTSLTKSQKRRISLRILLILMLIGIIIGTIIVGLSDNIKWLNRLMFNNNFYKSKSQLSIISQLFRNIMPLYAVLILQFFSGMFAFGQTLAVLTVVYRGIAAGISAAIVYLLLGIKGSLAILVTIFPFAALSAVLVILGARESIKLSGQLAKYFFFGGSLESDSDIKQYSLKFGILLLFALLFSFADAIITYFFEPIIF